MNIEVTDVIHPIGMFDTIIKFRGTHPSGDIIIFGVDHRPAKELFAAMQFAAEQNDPPIVVDLEDWQVLSRTEGAI